MIKKKLLFVQFSIFDLFSPAKIEQMRGIIYYNAIELIGIYLNNIFIVMFPVFTELYSALECVHVIRNKPYVYTRCSPVGH